MYSGESTFRVIFSILIIINVVGNSLVILVVLKNRASPMNYLLLNLAVADLMVGVFMAPVFVLDKTFTHPQGRSGDILCKFITSGNFTWVGALCSIFSLVLIAVERYYAIMKPTSMRGKITTKKLKMFIPICWSAAVVFNIPQFVADYYDAENLLICLQKWPTPWSFQLYSLLWLLIAGVLPTCTMAVLYIRVIYSLWFHMNPDNHITSQTLRRARKRVTKMMLMVTAIYVLCWCPDLVLYVLASFGYVPYRSPAQIAVISLALINSAANPIVYAFQFQQFRTEISRLACCGEPQVNRRAFSRNSVDPVDTVQRLELAVRYKEEPVEINYTQSLSTNRSYK